MIPPVSTSSGTSYGLYHAKSCCFLLFFYIVQYENACLNSILYELSLKPNPCLYCKFQLRKTDHKEEEKWHCLPALRLCVFLFLTTLLPLSFLHKSIAKTINKQPRQPIKVKLTNMPQGRELFPQHNLSQWHSFAYDTRQYINLRSLFWGGGRMTRASLTLLCWELIDWVI